MASKPPQSARSIDSREARARAYLYIIILLWCGTRNDRRITLGWNFEYRNYQLEFPARGDKGLVELFIPRMQISMLRGAGCNTAG